MLEKRGMKISKSKTEYMCVKKGRDDGVVWLQGDEVKKVEEFKYYQAITLPDVVAVATSQCS